MKIVNVPVRPKTCIMPVPLILFINLIVIPISFLMDAYTLLNRSLCRRRLKVSKMEEHLEEVAYIKHQLDNYLKIPKSQRKKNNYIYRGLG